MRMRSILIFAAGLGWLYLLYHYFALPNVTPLKYEHPTTSAFMRSYLFRHPLGLHHTWVDGEQIAGVLKRAVVASEDDEFFAHRGFNWEAIKRAARVNWKRRRIVRGASTITQQLAKNLYLSRAKTPTRKLKEFLIALKLERELSKDRILELYCNFAEWGPGIFGCQAAAEHYFKTDCRRLSAGQAAFLASILPNPARLGRNGFRMSGRAQQILRRM